jgi:KDO2-lipid IV(A) lauroyltransferase
VLQKILYFGLVYPISRLPFFLVYRLSDILFLILFYLIRYRRHTVYQNIKNAFPKYSPKACEKVSIGFYRHFCDLIVESLKLFTIREKNARDRMVYKNIELIEQLFKKQKNIVLMGGHYGNWELLAITINHVLPHQCKALYTPLRNSFWEEKMKHSRSRFGLHMVSIKKILSESKEKKEKFNPLLCTIYGSDQWPRKPEKAYWTSFLNQDTGFQRGAEKFARKNNEAVVFGKISKVRRGHYETEFSLITEEPTLEENNFIMESYKDMLEAQIKRTPAYYLWSHKRWKQPRPDTLEL